MRRFVTLHGDASPVETVSENTYRMQIDGTRTWLAKLGMNTANNPNGVTDAYKQAWQQLYNSLRYPGLALSIVNLIGGSPLVAGDPVGQFVVYPVKKGKFLDKSNRMYRNGEGYHVIGIALGGNSMKPDLFDLTDSRFKLGNLNQVLLNGQQDNSYELDGVFQVDQTNSVPLSFPNFSFRKVTSHGYNTVNINGIEYFLHLDYENFDAQAGDVLNPDFAKDYTIVNQFTFVIWTDDYTYGPILKPLPLGDAWWRKYEPNNNPYNRPRPTPAPVQPVQQPTAITNTSTIPKPAPSTIPSGPSVSSIIPKSTATAPPVFLDEEGPDQATIPIPQPKAVAPSPVPAPIQPQPVPRQDVPKIVIPGETVLQRPITSTINPVFPPGPAPTYTPPAPGMSTIVPNPAPSTIAPSPGKKTVTMEEAEQLPNVSKDLNYINIYMNDNPQEEEPEDRPYYFAPETRTQSISSQEETPEQRWHKKWLAYHQQYLQRKAGTATGIHRSRNYMQGAKVDFQREPKASGSGFILLGSLLATGLGLSYHYGKK